MLTSGMVISHTTYLAAMRGERDARYAKTTLAGTFARSGVTETISWFQRQSQQPVLAFGPRYEPAASPPLVETIDPAVGLVREFEIHGNLWGRYEVRTADALDISSQRGAEHAGSVWQLGVRSYVYRRADSSVPFDQAPNRLVATEAMVTEIRSGRFNPPAPSPICVDDPSKLHLGWRATVDGGGGPAFAYRDPNVVTDLVSPVPSIHTDAAVNGPSVPMVTYDAEAEAVFSMDLDEIRAHADIVLTRETASLASDDGVIRLQDSLVYVPRDLVHLGSLVVENCVVVVDGDVFLMQVTPTELSSFTGILYATGDVRLVTSQTFTGALISRGDVHIGERLPVTVRHDPQVIEDMRIFLNKYRERRDRTPAHGK